MNKKLKDSVSRKGLSQLSQLMVILHKRLVHTARQVVSHNSGTVLDGKIKLFTLKV